MLLAIDVGNTRIKAAVYEGNNTIDFFVIEKESFEKKVSEILNTFPKVNDLWSSSVGNELDFGFLASVKDINIKVVTHLTSFPFQNLYETPHTLGVDRMVLAAGATLLFPNQNRLVIDVGTCITYDFIDTQDNYLGGAISPGFRLRYQSLHQFTAKLPQLSLKEIDFFIGKSTNQSIHSGVINGIVHEIEGFINQYAKENENFTIILTGGDAVFLAKRLKNTIFANSNFLLDSLNQLFQFSNKND
ncbi:MAG: type III pantothenate kinase [Flavobacterium sp.]|jgi:type III pantothenate kinase|uniref:type III pantothenate kinase n=1 Tax=Flavobacterium sp. TaxID=239 RepID=UPI003BA5EA60